MPYTRRVAFRVVVVALMPFAGWYACGGNDGGSDQAMCQAEGYTVGTPVDDFCGCDNAALNCPGAEAVSHDACVCVEEGMECPSDLEGGILCGPDQSVMQCSGGMFVHQFDCPGLEQCEINAGADQVSCGSGDQIVHYALEGQPCADEQAGACNIDQSAVLDCQLGVWVRAMDCGSGVQKCERLHQGDPGVNCGGSPTCIGCGSL